MILLDTHAWIWWLSEPARLSPAAARTIDRADRVAISPISCWEIATKVSRGRLTLDRALGVWMRQALAHPRGTVLDVTPEIAVLAGELGPGELHGDPADRMIAATALVHHLPLVTKDERMHGFERLRVVW